MPVRGDYDYRRVSGGDGLALHLPFDDENDPAVDISGKERNGILQNGVLWTANGYTGGGLQFDGQNDYVEISNYKGVTGHQPRTSAAWININPASTSGTILSWGVNSPCDGSKWWFRVEKSSLSNLYRFGVGTWGGIMCGAITFSMLPSGIIQQRLSTEHPSRYQAVCEWNRSIFIHSIRHITLQTAGQELVHIGAYYEIDSMTSYFKGAIDEVCVYSRALSAEEIIELSGIDALEGYWAFDENLNDSSTKNPHSGVWYGTPITRKAAMVMRLCLMEATM
jgi:hypothetical protein